MLTGLLMYLHYKVKISILKHYYDINNANYIFWQGDLYRFFAWHRKSWLLVDLRFYVPVNNYGHVEMAHRSWVGFLSCLPVRGAYPFASNWQLPNIHQRQGENGRRNDFMAKSPSQISGPNLHEKMLPDVRI